MHIKPTRRQMKVALSIAMVGTFGLWLLDSHWGVMAVGTSTNLAWLWELEEME